MEHVDLRYNKIGDAGVQALSRLLSETQNLKTLNLEHNLIEPTGCEALAKALKKHTSLVYLNLNGNKIQTQGVLSICTLLEGKMVELDIGNNLFNHDAVIHVCNAISNSQLEVLNIDNPHLKSVQQETAWHLAKMLQQNRSLQKLSLRKHILRCDGMYTVCEHLLENFTLRVIDLTANEIAVEGAKAIAKVLKQGHCAIESLHLGCNKLGELGAKEIAQAIQINRSLIHIDLTYNNINDQGLCYLAESLMENPSLLSFKLFGNHFQQKCLQLFSNLFQTPRNNEWYPDFVTYKIDEEVQMAYVETDLPYDIYV